MVEICAVGGYSDVGKNMTAVRYGDEVVLLDMGLQLDKYIEYTEDDDLIEVSPKKLTEIGAIPDLKHIEDWRGMVHAIVPSHAHLDHIGAIPFLSNKFHAPIICTAFTKAVIEAIVADDGITLKNPIKALPANSSLKVSPNITIELIHITHSTPQSVMIAVHTPDGVILYTNDFKFDNNPLLGKPPNYDRLRQLGEKGILCLVLEALYSHEPKKTPSESIARDMLRDVLLNTDTHGKALFVTTFSSHIARIKSIIECGEKLNRKVVLLGRSLAKYVLAAERVWIVRFTDRVDLIRYSSKVKAQIRKYEKIRHKCLFIVTGHQGEQKSILSKLARGVIPFPFSAGDYVVFSSTVIPVEINIINRNKLEEQLRGHRVRIFRDVHVSGHSAKEDQRDLIQMVKPKYIIPAHCEPKMAANAAHLAIEMGYKLGENVHVMSDGARISLQ